MNKIIKFFIRIVIVILVLVLIFFCINKILEIKHKDKLANNINNEWDWLKENKVILEHLEGKYPSDNDENNLLIVRKNEAIPKKKAEKKEYSL